MLVYLVTGMSTVLNAIKVDTHMDIIIHGLQVLTQTIRVITLPTAAAQTIQHCHQGQLSCKMRQKARVRCSHQENIPVNSATPY